MTKRDLLDRQPRINCRSRESEIRSAVKTALALLGVAIMVIWALVKGDR